MVGKKKVIIDTDAGADDLLALMLAQLSNCLEIVAVVTSYGSFPVHESTSRVKAVLKHIVKDGVTPPIIEGSSAPLSRKYTPYRAVHGRNFLGRENYSTTRSKEKFPHNLLSCVSPRETYTYIVLGPLTNFFKIYQQGILENIDKIVILGGALSFPGNVTPLSEANFFWDPEAAQQVLSSSFAVDLIPLNVTEGVQLDDEKILTLKESTFVKSFFSHYSDYYKNIKHFYTDPENPNRKIFYKGGALHDPIAVLSVVDPDTLLFKRTCICLDKMTELDGFIYAQSAHYAELALCVNNSAEINVAKKINKKRFWKVFDSILYS